MPRLLVQLGMLESELHQRIYERCRGMAGRFGCVVVGPGDDCAVVRVGGAGNIGKDADATRGATLITVDQVVEGRHYLPGTAIGLIARKAVARSVSDIAAMGGVPAWGLATGVLPDGFAHAAELVDALHTWGERWGAPMVGGDIASSPTGTPLMLTVTIAGVPHARRGPVLRSGARVGDAVWVTGAFGGSLKSGRHLTFEPRVAEGAWLCDALGDGLRAMIDVSDGLGRDAGRIAAASGVRVEIDAESVPRHQGVERIEHAMRDGEDYELCFVVGAGVALPPKTPSGVKLTQIGRVVAGSGCGVMIDGLVCDGAGMGWDHGEDEVKKA